MSWKKKYTPPVNLPWQGRPDLPQGACFFQKMLLLDLNQPLTSPSQPAFALLGFCCDEGIKRNHGRPGAIGGPSEIRIMLAKLPVMKDNILFYDAGDISCLDGDLEDAQSALASAVNLLLSNHIVPIVLGGGHEMAWGNYQGIASCYQKNNLGIINFDAHFDMRPLPPDQTGSSGTPFLQIANAHERAAKKFDYNCIGIQSTGNIKSLFETAKHYHTHVVTAEDLSIGKPENQTDFVRRIIHDNDILYLSLCLDVFAAPFAPGVSAPQPMGIMPWSVIPLIRQLAASGKVISYDIAELSPPFDRDNRTAKLAASFVSEFIHHHHFS